MSGSNFEVKKAFWIAKDKPDGYIKKHGWTKAGLRDEVIKANGGIVYLLWGHRIAEFSNGVLTLSDAGYRTKTTKDRINGILHGNPHFQDFTVQQDRGVWWLGNTKTGKRYVWDDGAKIELAEPFKHLVETDLKSVNKTANQRSNIVNKFLDLMRTRIDDGSLSMDGGECWGALMGLMKCEECEFLAQDDCGGGVHLLLNALKECGYPSPAIFLCSRVNGEVKPDLETMKKEWNIIKHALRKYIKKKLDMKEYSKR